MTDAAAVAHEKGPAFAGLFFSRELSMLFTKTLSR
jgi:hypothetical protein